jgi:molecular chaperone GrpE
MNQPGNGGPPEPGAPANDDSAAQPMAAGADDDSAAQPTAASADAATITAQADEIAALKDKLLRALADGENMRRRFERDREEANKYGIAKFARDVVGVADNLRRAIDSANTPETMASLLAGVEVTERELLSVLERHGVRRIEAMGQPFDPNFHQAIVEIPDASQPPGTVVHVMSTGYTIAGRLLRPAMVGVAKAAPAPAGTPAAVNPAAVNPAAGAEPAAPPQHYDNKV